MSAAGSLPAVVPGFTDIAGICAAVPMLYAESAATMDDDAVDAACDLEAGLMGDLARLRCTTLAEAAAKAGLLAWLLMDLGNTAISPSEGGLLASLARDLRAMAALP